jgi:predicted AAA+ superfamily ATPase
MFDRLSGPRLLQAARTYPVVAVLGPRQSGKTTLVQATFPAKRYISLEDPDTQEYATTDPRRFLRDLEAGAVLDEVQRAPQLLRYIQGIVDARKEPGLFVLTGSQNLNLLEAISQSLAGRVSIHTLLPLALEELKTAAALPGSLEAVLFTGFYPRIHDRKLDPGEWLGNYVQTYVERDVRQVRNVGDFASFSRFLRSCAARSGHIVNLSSLGNDCGITHNTARAWLSVLEATYIAFIVQPYYENFEKRLRRSPKLYFHDTGLLCYLLGIRRLEDISFHASRGAIFETFAMSEILKAKLNRGLPRDLWFWQDKLGNEIDCVFDVSSRRIAVEFKGGETIASDFFKNISYWRRLTGAPREDCFLVHAGAVRQERSEATVLPWREVDAVPL